LIYIVIVTDRVYKQRGLNNGGDTVGQPPNAENRASNVPALRAQKPLESNAVIAAMLHGKRMTNSIGGFSETKAGKQSQGYQRRKLR
jgi:hypothetical protein